MRKIIGMVGFAASFVCSGAEICLQENDPDGSSLTSGNHWSGGDVPCEGNDYVVGKVGGKSLSITITANAWSGCHRFAGDHLVFRDGWGLYNKTKFDNGERQWLDVNLVVESGSMTLYPDDFHTCVNLMGTIDIRDGAVLKCTASDKPIGYRKIRLRSAISGSGMLQVYLPRFNRYSDQYPYVTEEKSCFLEGNNSAFTGRIIAGGCGDLYVLSEDALGRAPATFVADWLTLHGTHLCVTNDVTINDATRGITISDKSSVTVNKDNWSIVYPGGGFDVAAGKTLTLGSVLTAAGPVVKYGAGTLILANTLENIASEIVVSNGCLAIDGAGRAAVAPIRVASTTSLRLNAGASLSVGSLSFGKSSFSVVLTDRTPTVPAVSVTDALELTGPYMTVSAEGATAQMAGTAYALMRAPAGSLARRVREARIFLKEPWRGDLSVTQDGEGTETLWMTPHDQSLVYYLTDTTQSSISKAVWKHVPEDVTEEPSVANPNGVYIARSPKSFTMPGGTGTGWNDETFAGRQAVLDNNELCNATYGMCNTIPRLTMMNGCQLGFSRATQTDTPSFIIDGALCLLPVGESGTDDALVCCGFGSKRLLDIRSGLSGCGTLVLAGEIPPAREYNTYALSGDNTNYVGLIRVYGQTNFYCRISKEENLGGNPESFVADQLRFNGGGLSVAQNVVLDDANRGIWLDGTGGIARENGNSDAYNTKAGYVEADRVYHGGATFNTTASDVTLTVNCPIAGDGGVYVRAYGTVALGGDNAHTGLNVVQQGTLLLSSRKALGTGGLSVGSDGRVAVAADAANMPWGVELAGSLSFAAGGTVTVAGIDARIAAGENFAVPLFLLAPGETMLAADVPFVSPVSRGYKIAVRVRTVNVDAVDRQLVEVTFSRKGLLLLVK